MVPDSPTETTDTVKVVVEFSVLVVVVLSVLVVLDELLDEVQDMEMKLKRNIEKMMNICLTWFPNCLVQENPKYNINWFVLQECGKIVEVCLTCEELVGVTHRGMMGEGDY